MRINKIRLKNFRGFEELEIDFHKSFNIIVGINGTGKTAILEGLKIAAGSLMLGMDKIKDKLYSPGIDKKYDVYLKNFEKQWPTEIEAYGEVLGQVTHWSRELNGENNNTTTRNATEIKTYSELIQKEVKEGIKRKLPLIGYYSIDRFKQNKSEDKGIEPYGSRLRGYYNSLEEHTTLKFFLNLYRTETLAAIQEGADSELLKLVEKAIIHCIKGSKKVYHHVRSDELVVEFEKGEIIPFRLLSEGVRITLSIVMEIAFRCYLLNKDSLGKESLVATDGVILIDELDLHLHPSWQKTIVEDLQNIFPSIQFIVTTHSPMIIGSLREGHIFALKDHKVYSLPIQYGKDANSILIEMGTDERLSLIKAKLEEYFILIESAKGREEKALSLRQELETLMGASDTELQKADIMLSFFD